MDDFSYSHQLTRAMQTYPSRQAIEAPYRFVGFDAAAVEAVLAQLVPERLQVWAIDQAQEVSETLTFYEGQYAVEPLETPAPATLLARVAPYELALPAQNSLLPEQFAIVSTQSEPKRVIDEPGLSVWLQGSEAFAQLPRGYTQLYLNSPVRQQRVDAAVMMVLWADLYNLNETALITEAGIAGMGLSLQLDEGLRISISGFTDKQPELLAAALAALRVSPDEQALTQALDRFLRGLQNRKREMPVSQLGRTLSGLTQTGFYDEASLREAASQITPSQFAAFVDELLESALVRVYLFGNYDTGFAETMAQRIREGLPAQSDSASDYVRKRFYAPESGKTVAFNTDLPVDDLGMMLLYAAPEASVAREAAGRVLARHLRNRVFDTLRTEEQLGYAAGGIATTLQDHPMIGFYIQTPVKGPVEMLARFEAFAQEYGETLEALSADQFANLKSGVLTALTEPPTNLADEAGPFLSDWNRERYEFASRQQMIAAVDAVTIDDVRAYYRETVLAPQPSRILIQLRGERWSDSPFAMIEGATVIDSIEAFHESMPLQPLD
jgi:protease-3